MKKLRIIWALLPLVFLTSFTRMPSIKEQPALVIQGDYTIPLAGTSYYNPCPPNAETINFSQGEVHNHYTLVINKNGLHRSSHSNVVNCSGTGETSGLNYIVNGTQDFNLNDGQYLNGQYILHSRASHRIISQGGGSNGRIIFDLVLVFNSNGTLVHSDFSSEAVCN